jgi:HlyD family secretion protein
MSLQGLPKKSTRWIIGLVATGSAFTGAIALYSISQLQSAKEPTSELGRVPQVKKVTALGRLEPEAEVVPIAAPLALDGDRVAQLLVKEGDRVKAGQVIAILDSRDRLQDEVAQAQERVKMAQAKLAQVKAGAKTGEIQAQQAAIARIEAEQSTEIEAQQATIARIEAEQNTEIEAQKAAIGQIKVQLANAEVEYKRYQTLYREGGTSTSLLDSRRLALQTAQEQLNEAQANLKRIQTSRRQQLNEAQATLRRIQTSREQELKQARSTLDQIAEVRPVDVRAAQAEVDNAVAALKQAQTNLKQVYISAPLAGRILKIHTRPGAKISDSGIVEMAQTDQMLAVAEVYQTDIGKVRLGQPAVITSDTFPGELRGTVSEIGWQVSRQNVFSNQPGENLDRRVVEVKIRLHPEDSKRVEGLTNLQVQTAIE